MTDKTHDRPEPRLAVATACLALALGVGIATTASAQTIPQAANAVAGAEIDGLQARTFTEYLGGGYLTLGQGCEQYGWSGIHQILARAQPQGHPGNPDSETQLALFFATGTIAMRYDLEYSRRFVPVDSATYVWNGPWTPDEPTMEVAYDAYYGDWLMDEDDDLISVNIYLNNFNEHSGCSAEMRLALGRN
jgi:hypothetical protein